MKYLIPLILAICNNVYSFEHIDKITISKDLIQNSEYALTKTTPNNMQYTCSILRSTFTNIWHMCSSEYNNGEYPNIIFMEYSTIKGHEIPLSKNWKFVSFHVKQNN